MSLKFEYSRTYCILSFDLILVKNMDTFTPFILTPQEARKALVNDAQEHAHHIIGDLIERHNFEGHLMTTASDDVVACANRVAKRILAINVTGKRLDKLLGFVELAAGYIRSDIHRDLFIQTICDAL